jgi:hypothetical protein
VRIQNMVVKRRLRHHDDIREAPGRSLGLSAWSEPAHEWRETHHHQSTQRCTLGGAYVAHIVLIAFVTAAPRAGSLCVMENDTQRCMPVDIDRVRAVTSADDSATSPSVRTGRNVAPGRDPACHAPHGC